MAQSIPRQHTLRGLFTAFTVLTSIAVNVNATCYWPNATLFANNPEPDTISPDDHPCNPDAEASVCCGTGWTCLSDGVCKIRQDGNDFYYRGTCTDSTWKSQSCPGFCMQQNNATTEPLIKCNTPGEDWYCCAGDDQCDCSTGKFAVQLNGPATTLTVFGAAPTSGAASSSTSKAAVTSPASKSSSSLSSSSGTSTANPSATPAATSPVKSTTTRKSTNSTAVGVGVGVGVGVSLLIIVALSSWYRRRSRRRRQGQVDTNNTASQAGLGSMKQHLIHEGDGAPVHEALGDSGRYDGRRVGEERAELPVYN